MASTIDLRSTRSHFNRTTPSGSSSHAPPTTTQGMAALVATTHRGGAETIDRLADAWRSLARATENDWAFYTPTWLRTWYGVFGHNRPLNLVTVLQDGELVAIAPFIEHRIGPVRVWRAPANFYTGKADILIHPEQRDAIAAAVWRELETQPWHVLDWRLAPGHGAMAALVARRQTAGDPVLQRTTHLNPIVPLQPDIDAERIGPAKSVRRSKRRLAETGTIREVKTDPATPAQLDTFFRMEAAGWKGRGGTDAGKDPESAAFYRALVDLPKHGDFTTIAHEIMVDDTTVAIEIGVRSRDRHFALKGTYDEAWRRFGPGQISSSFLIRDTQAAGCSTFDFLGRDEPYKRVWTDITEPLLHLIVFRPDPVGRLACAAVSRGIPLSKRLRAEQRNATIAARQLPGRLRRRIATMLHPVATPMPTDTSGKDAHDDANPAS